jgi:hypothetical protein
MRGRGSVSGELDVARTFVDEPGEARRLLEDRSAGIAIGWTGAVWAGLTAVSAGVTRLAPLSPAPVFAAEYTIEGTRWPRAAFSASRSVRNRTLPRMPADGEAWVLEGIGLADERRGEEPEAVWRCRSRVGRGRRQNGSMLRIGSDLPG